MKDAGFEWDDKKAAANARKHGITFDEARSAFDDPLGQTSYDVRHSGTEERERLIGQSEQGKLLVVTFVERLPGMFRIISARQATRKERAVYEEFQGF